MADPRATGRVGASSDDDATERIKRLLDAALALPAAQRQVFLDRECVDEEERRELESLLRAFDQGDPDFLERPAVVGERDDPDFGETRALVPEASPIDPPGAAQNGGRAGAGSGGAGRERRIGPYRLLRTLGSGGMGTVYLAERADGQFRQSVAVKVMRRGVHSGEIVRRFLQERQILAGLSHPGIARLLDGGASENGAPYLAMEYVEGLTLLEHCDRQRLDTEARLRLFLEVCAAVQYAHQNLVVHRDLKPGNILVTEAPGAPAGSAGEPSAGTVKLLDFGIAKVLNPALAPVAGVTRTEVRVMTPEYASPEQVRGEPVTTSSDVYSLGVVLYELLTGQSPFPRDSKGFYDLSRLIVEEDPELPSTAVGRTHETVALDGTGPSRRELTPAEVSRRRRTDPTSLRRRLRGDLDAIVLKAMRKEPSLRYASVARLAEDIAHHLDGLPVSAAGDTARYRMSKYLRRHRWAVLASAALLVSALLAGVFHTIQVTRERDRARSEARRAEAVTEFLVDLFEVADPGVSRGREVTAREMLDRGADRLEGELAGEPRLRARLYDVVGSIYQRLGVYERADPYLERATELSREVFGSDSVELANSAAHRAGLLVFVGEYEEAEPLVRERLEENRRIFGPRSAAVAQSLDTLATLLQETGRYEEARPPFEEALEIRREVLGEDDPLVSTSLNNLARLHQDLGEYERAESLLRRSVALDRQIFGSPHPELAVSTGNLGMLLRRRFQAGEIDDLEEAAALVGEAYEMQREVLGENHSLTGNAANDLALVLADLGEDERAEELYREALEIHRRAFGEHTMVAVALNNLASVLSARGSYEEAESMFRESLDLNRRLLGEGHPDTSYQLQGLGSLYAAWDQPERAIEAYSEALEIRRTVLGDAHPITLSSVVPLARLYVARGEAARAESLLRDARAAVVAAAGDPASLRALDEALAGTRAARAP